MSEQAIALNRFGLGARADEAPPADPRRWVLDQLDRYDPRPGPWAAVPDTAQLTATGVSWREQQSAAANDVARGVARKGFRDFAKASYAQAADARLASALTTTTPFVERLVHFWSNHFCVSADKITVTSLVGSFEADVVRPHVLGRFPDMLLAAERHPAMQMFLDQQLSIGPNSPAGLRRAARQPDRGAGLNENLAREIMELHTLGVRTGYTQADVTEFARAMTGWGLGAARGRGAPGEVPGLYVFHADAHEPGARTIRGKVYGQAGEAQPLAVLADLAVDPATATHVATKLCRHFIADTPPPAAIERVQAAFLASGGDLPTVYRALIASPEAWLPAPGKFKTPWDWQVSTLRAIGAKDERHPGVLPTSNLLGQPIWRPQSPAGWDDVAATWAAPDALVKRLEVAQTLATGLPGNVDARALAPKVLPGVLTPATQTALARADDGVTALALLLVSPEFQRR